MISNGVLVRHETKCSATVSFHQALHFIQLFSIEMVLQTCLNPVKEGDNYCVEGTERILAGS